MRRPTEPASSGGEAGAKPTIIALDRKWMVGGATRMVVGVVPVSTVHPPLSTIQERPSDIIAMIASHQYRRLMSPLES